MHHASLLIGSTPEALAYVEGLFGSLTASPDYFRSTEEIFGIEEARTLSAQAIRRSFGARKIFFIAPERITLEAQNALLKAFEEPIAETYFFLVVRTEAVIIPTLRSRMQSVRLASAEDEAGEAQKFLSLPLKERLVFVKKFLDKERNVSAFLDALLATLREKGLAGKVFPMRLVSDQRGASDRLILEHVATVL